MSAVRTLKSPPRSLELYARAALPLIPGASLLPFVAGRGGEIPTRALVLGDVRVDPKHLADYSHVCGFTLRDPLPATYLHVRAFPLHMALMTDGSFPFPAVGLVHLQNRITTHRRITAGETFDLHVHATKLEPHPKGKTFTIVTEARVDGELVWEDHSTMLRRGKASSADAAADASAAGSASRGARAAAAAPSDAGATDADRAGGVGSDDSRGSAAGAPTPATGPARSTAGTQAEWQLAGDLGRRYASVSGDHNPIHLHQATARLFGFPKAIAHGMWTKARCLAALEQRLPDAYTVDVSFRKPILLPGAVSFGAHEERFSVCAANNPDQIHLEGTVTP